MNAKPFNNNNIPETVPLNYDSLGNASWNEP